MKWKKTPKKTPVEIATKTLKLDYTFFFFYIVDHIYLLFTSQ